MTVASHASDGVQDSSRASKHSKARFPLANHAQSWWSGSFDDGVFQNSVHVKMADAPVQHTGYVLPVEQLVHTWHPINEAD